MAGARIAGVIRRGLEWWVSELRALALPAAALFTPRLNTWVEIEGSGYRVMRRQGPRRALLTIEGGDAGALLSKLAKQKRRSRVGLCLPGTNVLERQVEVPAGARREVQAILNLDLERSTPFKPSSVYSGYVMLPSLRKDWRVAHHVIAKRADVEHAIARLGMLGLTVVSIEASCEGASDRRVPLLPPVGHASIGSVFKIMPVAALVLGAALCVSAIMLAIANRQAALDDLDRRIAEGRQRLSAAQQASASTLDTSRQRAALWALLTGRKPLVEVIDNITELLDDDVYLESLKYDGGAVEIAGFAKSAAEIVPKLERSQAFKDVEAVAPVTFDGNLGKEHFVYRLKGRSGVVAHNDVGTGETALP